MKALLLIQLCGTFQANLEVYNKSVGKASAEDNQISELEKLAI